MNQTHLPKRIGRQLSGGILITIILVLISACEQASAPPPVATDTPAGFTFLEIGSTTIFSSTLRKHLDSRLGSSAISRRGLIDLDSGPGGVLDQNFPSLAELNQVLNFPPNERVEHQITRLMYRYAIQKQLPFRYIELTFANDNNKPLLFRIDLTHEANQIIDELNAKYGPPKRIADQSSETEIHYWQDQEDYLMITQWPNRGGMLQYQLTIYYVDNLSRLAATSKSERVQRADIEGRAGRKVF
jgi:hypothetical protein